MFNPYFVSALNILGATYNAVVCWHFSLVGETRRAAFHYVLVLVGVVCAIIPFI